MFSDVDLILILDEKELSWTYPVGESLQTLLLRLHHEQHIQVSEGKNIKFYLDTVAQENYMMDPLSLNDFPSVLDRIEKKNTPIRIVVKVE